MKSLVIAARTGFSEIRAHKTRSILSFLAIAVGAVVFINAFSAICATYERLKKQKDVSGIARLKISQNNSRLFSSPDAEYTPPPAFTYEDVLLLKRKMPGLYMVSPEARDWHDVLEYNGRRVNTNLLGVAPDWIKRDFVYTLRGRFLNWHDLENKLRVCVLIKKAPPPPGNSFEKSMFKKWNSAAAFDTLVSHNDLLGKPVKIEGVNFTVIGILEELPASKREVMVGYSNSKDVQILAPVTTLTHFGFISARNSLDVSIDTGSEQTFEESLKLIKNFLKIRFGDEDSFIIENQMELIRERTEKSVKNSLMTISLGMLAFIAGGIGIMNVTLATVFARTKEIGVRRAIGANRGDIMLQFIVEAVLLGLIGGVLGSGIGYVWNGPVRVIFGMGGGTIKPWIPLVSVLIAAFTSFAFAIYPAWVAANLKPADALRAE